MGANWRCQCGHVNEPEFTMCLMCGKTKGADVKEQAVVSAPSSPIVQDNQPPKAKADADTKWNARKQQNNASSLGRISWKTPLKKTEPSVPMTDELAPADVFHIIEAIEKGNEEAIRSSMGKLIRYRPRQAIAPLLKIATGRTINEERRIVAIQALGEIGDKTIAQEFVKIKEKISWDREKIQTCMVIIAALGNIGDPVAVPSLLEDQGSDEIVQKSMALYALAKIGDPSVLDRLVMDVGYEIFRDNLTEGMQIVGRGFVGSALDLISMASQANLNKHNKVRMMPLVVGQDIPLEMIIQAPADIRQAWVFKLRMWVIANICYSSNAFNQLAPVWQRANSPKKKLLIAISGLICDPARKDFWTKCVVEVCQRGDRVEKAIAYDALVRLGEINLAAPGLRDSDQAVVATTASSAIGLMAEPLYSSALPLASSNLADFRFGLVPSVLTAGLLYEEPRAIPLAKALLSDRDSDVKGFANQYKDFVMEDKQSFLERIAAEQNVPEPKTQPRSTPKWSNFGS